MVYEQPNLSLVAEATTLVLGGEPAPDDNDGFIPQQVPLRSAGLDD